MLCAVWLARLMTAYHISMIRFNLFIIKNEFAKKYGTEDIASIVECVVNKM